MKTILIWVGVFTLLLSAVHSENAGATHPSRISIRNGKIYHAHVRFLIRYEKRHPEIRGMAKNDWIRKFIQSAYAADGECMLAGFVGKKIGSRCKPAPDSSFETLRDECKSGGRGTVPCNPDVFGPGICITPSDNRWTMACAEAAYVGAGVPPAVVASDADPSNAQAEKLGEYAWEKNIDLNKAHEQVKLLCAAADASRNEADIADCEELATNLASLQVGASSNASAFDQSPICFAERANTGNASLEEFAQSMIDGVVDQEKLKFDPNTMKACKNQLVQMKQSKKSCYESVFSTEASSFYSDWLDVLYETHTTPEPKSFFATVKMNQCTIGFYNELDPSKCPPSATDGGAPQCTGYFIENTIEKSKPILYGAISTDTKAQMSGKVSAWSEARTQTSPNAKTSMVNEMTARTFDACADSNGIQAN